MSFADLPDAPPKPTQKVKGGYKRAREADKVAIKANERREKAKVVARDGAACCRLVPGCRFTLHETAHLHSKKMGGDHGHRTKADLMIRACREHHRGSWSLHSGDLKVRYLTEAKADGPIAVSARNPWGEDEIVGVELTRGVWA